MAYTIEFAPAAERQFIALPKPIQVTVLRRIEKLAATPRPHGIEKLKGMDDIYRLRSGNYRILYTIKDKNLIVLIIKIGDRKDVYRGLPKV